MKQKPFDLRKYIAENKFTLGNIKSKNFQSSRMYLNEASDSDKSEYDKKYTHVGYGNYKKTSEKDKKDADIYKKDSNGKYILSSDWQKQKDAEWDKYNKDNPGDGTGKPFKPKVNIFDKPKAKTTKDISTDDVSAVYSPESLEDFVSDNEDKLSDKQKAKIDDLMYDWESAESEWMMNMDDPDAEHDYEEAQSDLLDRLQQIIANKV